MLKFNTQVSKTNISTPNLSVDILSSGDIYEIYKDHIRVNLLRGNILDGSVSNIYLRSNNNGTYDYAKLLGVDSNSEFIVKDNKVIYQGIALEIKYQVVFSLVDNYWYYDILLDKTNNEIEYDLFYGQDVSVADKGMLQSSESYTGQYVDHKVFSDNGYTILTRQNQGQPNLVQIGSFDQVKSYSTDGFQFFGLSYKETNKPKALFLDSLENKNYQYEFPYIALQTKSFKLNEQKVFSFYGMFVQDYPEIRTEAFEAKRNNITYDKFLLIDEFNSFNQKVNFGKPITGLTLTNKELKANYKNIRNEEIEDDKLLAFFADAYKHVISKEKELLVERPHGHIIIHGDLINATENVMASTGFMSGIFSSHIVLGNTNFHKLSGDVRNMLNIQKIAGLRIYIKANNKYHLLTMPSLFEVNANSIKWLYQLDEDTLEVTYTGLIDALQQSIEFKSKNNITYDILMTQPIIMGDVENVLPIDFKISDKEILFTAQKNQMVMNKYPNLKYRYTSMQDVNIYDDQFIFGSKAENGMLVLEYNNVANIKLNLEATLEENFEGLRNVSNEQNEIDSNNFYHNIIPLKIDGTNNLKINSFNDLSFWYVHNALVHYASPHGLEQFNGAAWGTRDVCQGPFELFITAQKYDVAKDVLLRTFERQFIETGDFPQWFMFDKYYEIQAHDSHGDIIVWPLKALAHYLEVTNDVAILDEKLSYMSLETNNFTKEKYSLANHVEKILDTIESSEIENIKLPGYGGGDWNDTLQPANQELTKKMVSTWTVSLLYEALNKLEKQMPQVHDELKTKIKTYKDIIKVNYYKYLVVDNIPTGFTIFDGEKREVLLHPNDKTTGLKYRLLSFNRGIISELFDKVEIPKYLDIITKNLKHPDGVRLMNDAVTYQGGKNTYFMRAETAANFGREVGLHYIHAHLRYIESMTKIGNGENSLEGLTVINPINIRTNVKNAMHRQSNTYFSSSDGNFSDRYIAKANFDKLRTGDVLVKAGWRVYSSGPGIYLNQLIGNNLGIKVLNNDLLIDPVLSKEFDGAIVTYKYLGKDITVNYKLSDKLSVKLNNEEISTSPYTNKYKENGFIIAKQKLSNLDNINISIDFKA